MLTSIKPWGNSQGLYIPKSLLREIGLAINDSVELSVQNGAILIKKNNKHEEKLQALENLERLRTKTNTNVGPDYREEYLNYLDERYQV